MKRILIADDDSVMVKLLEFNLGKAGYDVAICREGSSVIDMARDTQPVAVVFDLMLPGRSGLELITAFKSDYDLKKIPLVIVTGQGKDSTRAELLEAGATAVFTKPFSPKILISSINELLALSEQGYER